MGTTLLHIATVAEWTAARRRGAVAPESLAIEGFVHCSTPEQIDGVVERYYRGRDDLVLLTIDPGVVPADVRWENGFPHVYGPIPVAAVTDARPWGSR